MAIPKDAEIPASTSQFVKLKDGPNRFRVLSDVTVGWEGWKDNKPFRHPGNVCRIKPEQVDLNKNQRPNINYFWAMVVWDYSEKRVRVLELTQKTIMSVLYDYEKNADWGDLKNYDIEIIRKKENDKVAYNVVAIPPKPLSPEIITAYEEAEVKLEKIFDGEYPMPEKTEPNGEVPDDEIPF